MDQPLQQGIQQGSAPMMVQANPFSFMHTLDKFRNVMGVFIKQKKDFMENLTGCERGNTYKIFACDENGDKKKKLTLFKAKEKSSYYAKNCCTSDARPFIFNIYHENNDGQGNDGQDSLFFERKYTCTCFCLNRPIMNIYMTEGGQKLYLGKIINPCNCCDLSVDIYDNQENLKFQIKANCCQLGLCFPRIGCGPCKTVQFDVNDSNGNKIGDMLKSNPGCFASAFTDADNFSMIFPQNSTPEDRALLTSSIILLDFMYFEETPGEELS